MNGRKVFAVSRALVEIGLFSACINVLLLVMPLYMLQIYDRIIPSSSMETLFYISVIALLAVLVLGLLEAVRALYANRVAARLDVVLGPRLFAAAVTGPRGTRGEIQPLRDLATIRGFIGSRTLFFLFDLPFAPFFVALLFLVHPVLFAVTLAGAALMAGLALANHAATRKSSREAAERSMIAMANARSFARSSESLRTLGMTAAAGDFWGERFARALKASDRLTAVNAGYGSITRGMRILLQIAMYGLGAYFTLKGEMTAGMIFAASMISARALQPLDQIVGGWKQIADAASAWKRIRRCIDETSQPCAAAVALPAPTGNIGFENVVYRLPGTQRGDLPLIKGISFELQAGHSLAVIGPSRAGKSTLVRLMVGAIEPASGCVRLDGADIRQWEPDRLGAGIGYLSQEVEFFPATIGQNIARFDRNASSQSIIAAAERAHAHGLILAQPQGYETQIGPDGVRLSGGERQRIGLARAFFGDPRLIVLDEPNAGLDAEGEAALDRAVNDARARGATVVVVTHRPSIAARCDRVLVLRDGRIEQFGPTGEVMGRVTAMPAPTSPRRAASSMAANAPAVEAGRLAGEGRAGGL